MMPAVYRYYSAGRKETGKVNSRLDDQRKVEEDKLLRIKKGKQNI